MFGHVSDREHSSRWLISSFLFAIALAWSFAMQDRSGESPVSFGTMLAVVVGLAGLRVGIMLIGGKRRRRERRAERHADGGTVETDEAPTEEPRPTYEEIFGAPIALDGPSDQLEPLGDGENDPNDEPAAGDGDDGPSAELQDADGDGSMSAEVDTEHAQVEGMGEPVETGNGEADWMSDEVQSEHAQAEGMGEPVETEVDEAGVDVEAIRSELESEEAIRRLREEFKARAREAEFRIQQRQAELDQASSAPTSV